MKIIHIFQGNVLHTTPGVISLMKKYEKRLIDNSDTSQFFCVAMYGKKMRYDNVEENPYPELFKGLSHQGYKLFYSPVELTCFLIKANKEDKVLFHTTPAPKDFFLIEMGLLLFNRTILKRSSIILWGGDYKIPSTSFIKRAFNRYLCFILSSFKYVAAISTDDEKITKASLPKANVIYCPYMDTTRLELNYKGNIIKEKITVMVSHSGWPQNNHHYSFELLKQYVGHISVVCPLCYGQEECIQSVIKEGQELFGDDFSYFTDLKAPEEYRRFLQTVDVFITAAEHQTGMGNIFLCMANGTKIFVKGNLLNSLKEKNYIVYDLDSLKNMSLVYFKSPLKYDEAKKNVDLFNYLRYEGNESLDAWRKIFSY